MKKKLKSIWWHKDLEKKEIIKSLSHVINSEELSTGKITSLLEKEISKFLKVKHIIMVSSGSMANLLAFMALNIRPKDEIIIPNVGWISVINACKILNATPVIIDVQKSKPLIDVEQIEKFISKIVRNLEGLGESEIPTATIGKFIMEGLSNLDKVAYVRFASVYKNFKEAKDFEQFVGNLDENKS